MYSRIKTVIFGLSVFLILLFIASGVIYFSFSKYISNELSEKLRTKATIIAEEKLTSADSSLSVENLSTETLLKEKALIYRIDSTFNKKTSGLALPQMFFSTTLKEGENFYKNKGIFYKSLVYEVENQEYLVIVSAENHLEHKIRSYLLKFILCIILLVFFISIVYVLYTTRVFFKSLVKITERVQEISSENLHLRLESNLKSSELNELSTTFNDMLNRIATSFETQNNFISNASHELRTPLTAIIGETDVCLSKRREPEEYIETLNVIMEEAEKLHSKTKALLFLAQSGFNGKTQKFERIRIDQLIWDVKETMEKIDSNNKICIDMSMLPENPFKLKVKANEQLLHLALSNIIGNACKYSNYKDVNVSIGSSDNYVFIVIKDSGIGIPANELKYIYDPFFRASNTKNFEGYGIGMPLSQNIIKMHCGRIIVNSIENRGTTVQIGIPIWTEK